MKSEFRTTKSLAADLKRIETSIVKNSEDLTKYFSSIRGITFDMDSFNGIELQDNVTTNITALRDTIDGLETDMVSIEGIDVYDFKNSPDEIIGSLRKLNEHSKNLDKKFEDQIKLIIKAKGNSNLQGEIDLIKKDVDQLLSISETTVNQISSSLQEILKEINHYATKSKEFLQHKII